MPDVTAPSSLLKSMNENILSLSGSISLICGQTYSLPVHPRLSAAKAFGLLQGQTVDP